MSKEVIEKTRELVKAACYQPSNGFGADIWRFHIEHVVKHGRRLAQQRHADSEVVVLSALLHDYAGIKSSQYVKLHHIHGALEAQRWLTSLSYPDKKIQQIQQCILQHRGSVLGQRDTTEAQCLADADGMAHFDGLPSLFSYLYKRKQSNVEDAVEWLSAKLTRSWNKLSADAQELSRVKYESCLCVLNSEPESPKENDHE
jgi:uncharacterized protein